MKPFATRLVPLAVLVVLAVWVGNCGGDDDPSDPGPDGGNPDGGHPDGGNPDGGNPDGGGPDAGGADVISVDTTPLEFEHVVGETDCPQLVADVPYSNLTDVEITCYFTVNGDATTRMYVDPSQFTLAPNGGSSFGLFFDCTDTNPFEGFVLIECSDAAEDLVGSVRIPIVGNVHSP